MAITNNSNTAPPYPKTGYSWYVVVVLTLAYTVSFIDRQIMALMVEPIRRVLDISDTQMSLLLGLAIWFWPVPAGHMGPDRRRGEGDV